MELIANLSVQGSSSTFQDLLNMRRLDSSTVPLPPQPPINQQTLVTKSPVMHQNSINRQPNSTQDHHLLNKRKIESISTSEHQQNDVFTQATKDWEIEHPDQAAEQKNNMGSYILEGKNDKIAELISKGYDINAIDEGTEHPLITAIYYGSLDTVLLLLKSGADANTTENFSSTNGIVRINHILKMAADIRKIVLLLSYGADPFAAYSEYINAIDEERTVHSRVYDCWQGYCQKHSGPIPKPGSVTELNKLIRDVFLVTSRL